MLIHVYMNNIADLVGNKLFYGIWETKFALSILMLSIILWGIYKIQVHRIVKS